jgi:hypothetical protein
MEHGVNAKSLTLCSLLYAFLNPRILLSQAKLAPTGMMLIETRHVGATFGCDEGS